jgi:hypothetical protein
MCRKKIGSKAWAENKVMDENPDPKHKKHDVLIPRQMVKP